MAEFGSMMPAPMPQQPEPEIDPRLLAHLIPMWLQSAAAGQNQSTAPMTTALPGYEQRDPAELAALRQSNTVRPIAGRAGEGPTVRDIFNVTPVGALANTLSAATPAITTAIDLPAAAVSQIGREETGLGQAKKQQQSESNVAARVGAAAAGADDRKNIMAEQKDLQRRGYYNGSIDGNAGPDTLAARASAARDDESAKEKGATDRAAAAAAGKKADADLATANATAEAAKAALEKAKLDKENLAYQKAGSARNAQLESEVGPVSQVLRDYGPAVGYGLGALGGFGVKRAVVAASDRISGNAASKAEALFNDAAEIGGGKAGNLDKMTRVNEFWRKGGAGEAVPFQLTPGSAPGFAANEGATPVSGLYAPKVAKNAAIDVGIPAVGVAESGYGQFVMAPQAHQELKDASEAADKNPSDANLRRVQAAKNSVAIAEMMTNAGRAFAGTYAGTGIKMQRAPTAPSMREPELTRAQVEDWLRGQSAAAARPVAPATPLPPQMPGPPQIPPRSQPSRIPAPSSQPLVIIGPDGRPLIQPSF